MRTLKLKETKLTSQNAFILYLSVAERVKKINFIKFCIEVSVKETKDLRVSKLD